MIIEDQEKIVEDWRPSGKMMNDWCEENSFNRRTLETYSRHYNDRRGLSKKRKIKSNIVELIPVKTVTSKLAVNVGKCSIDIDDNTDLNLLKKVAMVLGNA